LTVFSLFTKIEWGKEGQSFHYENDRLFTKRVFLEKKRSSLTLDFDFDFAVVLRLKKRTILGNFHFSKKKIMMERVAVRFLFLLNLLGVSMALKSVSMKVSGNDVVRSTISQRLF
jgi:hypothetical protein